VEENEEEEEQEGEGYDSDDIFDLENLSDESAVGPRVNVMDMIAEGESIDESSSVVL